MSNEVNSKSVKMSAANGPTILALDTATDAPSVSVARGAEILATISYDKSGSHSTELLWQIEKVFEKASVSINEIDLYAVACGPGSFTGLRVGISTIKGFAFATGKPCVCIRTLEALAHSCGESYSTCAVIPSVRSDVYSQRFRVDDKGKVSKMCEPLICSFSELLSSLCPFEKVLWVGSGVERHFEEFSLFAKEKGIEIFNDCSEQQQQQQQQSERPEKGWIVCAQDKAKRMSESLALLAYEEYLNDRTTVPELLHAEYGR